MADQEQQQAPPAPEQEQAAPAEKKGFGRGGRGQRERREGGAPRQNRGPRRFGGEQEWTPLTKLGRLVKAGKIKSLETIFQFSIPIKEYQIVDHFLKNLKEEPLALGPVQKQTCAGQRTRFKAYVVVGDNHQHIGLGWKSAKEVQGAIKGAVINAKLNLIPVRKGYWGNKIAQPHTVPCKVTGKEGSVRVRLVPAPRGTGIVAAITSKKVLQMAGIQDCYTQSKGSTRTRSNFLKATFHALKETYNFLTPDLWGHTKLESTPFQEHSEYLAGLK
ncbi:unnamed protein product [Paramecium pentaurelia]|uniref:Small ribosomal subunit protein uS5 n=1 Tax=Paramecium pentaurelia TaxID=43138 RepID=A0A8S1WN09_9CILI|nr:unnamed protein product [Paramecium pentaurelia]